MKKIISTLSLSMLLATIFGQDATKQYELRTLTKLDLGLQGICFTLEPRIGRKTTIDLSAGAGGGYAIAASDFTYNWEFLSPAFYFSATPKYYKTVKEEWQKAERLPLIQATILGFV